MAHSKGSTPVSAGLAVFGNLICFMCLGVSAVQAATWLYANVPDPVQRWVFIFAIVSILLGSQAIVRITFHAWQNGNPKRAVQWGVLCVLLIECVSVFMSNMSFDGNLLESRRHQNMVSPEYTEQLHRVNGLKSELAELRQARRSTPTDQRTNRSHITQEIQRYEALIDRETRNLNSIDVSTSGAAIDRLEDSLGLTQSHLTFFLSVMLSIVHLTWAVLDASFLWSKLSARNVVNATKKQKARLRAVA